MTNVNELDLPEVNVVDPEFHADIYGHYRRARQQHWLAQTPMGVMVLGYQEMKELLLMDDKLEPGNKMMTKLLGAEGTSFGDFNDKFLLAQQGSDHKRIRDLVAPTFTPRNANLQRSLMRDEINKLLDEWLPKGEFEFSEFASFYPITVMCRLIGAPAEDVPRIKQYLEVLGAGYNMTPDGIPVLSEAVDFMWNVFDELLDARRQSTDADREKDLLDQILEASVDGDQLTDEELHYLLMVLYAAGYDTSKNLLTMIMHLMIDNPDMWAKLVDNVEYAGEVVDEALRFATVVTVIRVVRENFTYNGVEFPQGTMLLFPTPFAGRDEDVFKDADEFNPERVVEERNIAFGRGIHICLGQFIAKAQVQEALPILAARMHNPRRTGDVEWRAFMAITGLARLPIAFDSN